MGSLGCSRKFVTKHNSVKKINQTKYLRLDFIEANSLIIAIKISTTTLDKLGAMLLWIRPTGLSLLKTAFRIR
jgi:hypothetical protein